MKNLRNMFRFAKPVTPGFGLSANFYLVTFVPTTQLPTLSQVCNPTADGGAEAAMIVPLDAGATKQALNEPLRMGKYAIASLDKKTVIELVITGIDATTYNPPAIADTAWAAENLSDDIRHTMRATWILAQFRFRSHHPMVAPALQLIHGVASRLAELTDGLVCDPLAEKYALGKNTRLSEGLVPNELVTFQVEPHQLVSRGMVKFGMPEVSIRGFSLTYERAAANLLLSAIHSMLQGRTYAIGDKLTSENHVFRLVADPDARAGERPVIEFIPDDVVSVDDALSDFVEG